MLLSVHVTPGGSTSQVIVPTDRVWTIVERRWWGINDHIREIADQYAEEGYDGVPWARSYSRPATGQSGNGGWG